MRETIFGNQESFAIRYVPGYKSSNGEWFYANLHLILGGQIIGDPEEECSLLSWIYQIKKFKNRILLQFDKLQNKEFENRPDDEVFELVWKANGSNNPKYSNLQVLDESVWFYCHVSIDETSDAWLITLTEDNQRLKFIWKGLRSPCPNERVGKLFSVTVDREFVIVTLENCIKNIEEEYLNYPVK
jgi:hypothetical protein